MRGPVHTPAVDMVDQTIAGFTVLERAGNVRGNARWRCRHSCGGEVIIEGITLRNKPPKSCPACAGSPPPRRIVTPYDAELADLDELAGVALT